MLKRVSEFILGVFIILFLLGGYADEHHPKKLVIEYITGNPLLQLVIVIVLVIVASRLIAGKPKDYSKFVYNLLVKFFGPPTRRNK